MMLASFRRFLSTKTSTLHAKGPVSWPALALTGICGSGLLYYYTTEKDRLQTQSSSTKIKSVGKALVGGPYTLVDTGTRKAITDATLFGGYQLLYFGFTRCPDICPNELVRIGEIVDIMSKLINIMLNLHSFKNQYRNET